MWDIGNGYHILTREEWGATLSPGPARPGNISEVWLHHSVTVAEDDYVWSSLGDVISDMLEIESIGARRFGRFPYSFCFHPSGIIAEGGGWDVVGAHTANHNSRGLGLSAIGNFQVDPLPVSIRDGMVQLLLHGRDIGKLGNFQFPTGGHRDVKATACPGDYLYQEIDYMRQAYAGQIIIPPVNPQPIPPYTPPTGGTVSVTTDLPVLSKSTRATNPQHTAALQSMLNIKTGSALVVDGDFYRATEAAVLNLQAFFGLAQDGIVGTQTWGVILWIPPS